MNFKQGLRYCNMNGVYKFLGTYLNDKNKFVWAFRECEYDEIFEIYTATDKLVLMDDEEALTLDYYVD